MGTTSIERSDFIFLLGWKCFYSIKPLYEKYAKNTKEINKAKKLMNDFIERSRDYE